MSLARWRLHYGLTAKIADGGQIHVLDVPPAAGTGHCVERGLTLTGASNQDHSKHSPATFTRRFTNHAELVVREKALKNDRSPLELGTFHRLTRGPARCAPDSRHGLNVPGTRCAEKLFDCKPRRRSAGQLASRRRWRARDEQRKSGSSRMWTHGRKHEPEP
jgi:hypothetical protein